MTTEEITITPFDGFELASTTQIPDALFDELLSKLTGAELKVLLYIMRRTRGFQKQTDAISLTQFQRGIIRKDGEVLDKGCGVTDRKSITRAIANLEKKGCIQREKGKGACGDYEVSTYSLHYKEVGAKSNHLPIGSEEGRGKIQPPVGAKTNQGRGKNPQGVGAKSNPQYTVLQYTVLQQTVLQQDDSVTSLTASDTPPLSPVEQMWNITGDTEEHPIATDTPTEPSGNEASVPQATEETTPSETVPSVPEAQEEAQPEKPAKKPRVRRAAKPPVEKPAKPAKPTPTQIDAVFTVLDECFQQANQVPDFHVVRSLKATGAVKALIASVAYPEVLRKVFWDMWEEQDYAGGYFWRDPKHLTVPAICNQYTSRAVKFLPKGAVARTGQSQEPDAPRTRVTEQSSRPELTYFPTPPASEQPTRTLFRSQSKRQELSA